MTFETNFNSFIPVVLIDYVAIVILIAVLIGVTYKFTKWKSTIPRGLFGEGKKVVGSSGIAKIFFSELLNRVLTQKGVINDSKARLATHLLVFWGFLGLAFATVWDDVFFHGGVLPPPLSLSNPGNIVGNFAGVSLLVGLLVMIARYSFVKKFQGERRGDLTFLVLLFIVTLSGFATEIIRFTGGWLEFGNYAFHLAVVTALLVTAPFTHFFHAILTPFQRYYQRIHSSIMTANFTGDLRRKDMLKVAEDTMTKNSGSQTYPEWLRKRESKPQE